MGLEGGRVTETDWGGRGEGPMSVLDTHTQNFLGTKEIPGREDLGLGIWKAAFWSLDSGLV